MLAVWLVLLGWHFTAGHIGLPGNLLFVALLMVPLCMSGIEAATYRRHAFRAAYLTGPSWLDRLLALEPLLLASEGLKALLLALLLMLATLSLSLREWVLLLLDLCVLALLMPRLPGLLHTSVKPLYLHALARRWAIWFSTALLWLEAVLTLVLARNDSLRGLAWTAAVAYAAEPLERAGSRGLVAAAQGVYRSLGDLATWASDRLVHGGDNPAQDLIAALVLAALLLLWFCVAWAYSRALIGTMARPFAIGRPQPRHQPAVGTFEPWWH